MRQGAMSSQAWPYAVAIVLIGLVLRRLWQRLAPEQRPGAAASAPSARRRCIEHEDLALLLSAISTLAAIVGAAVAILALVRS